QRAHRARSVPAHRVPEPPRIPPRHVMAARLASWYGTAMRNAACVGVLVAALAARAAADTDWVPIDRVVAVVNHDIILASELDRELGTISELAAITDDAARAKKRDELRP